MPEDDPLKGDKPDRGSLVPTELHQALEDRHLDHGLFQIESCGRVIVKRMRLRVEKPFAGRVEFLENVLDHPEFGMNPLGLPDEFSGRATGPVVLPSSLEKELPLRIFSGDQIGKSTPEGGVHRVKVASRRIGPSGDPVRSDRIRGAPAKDQLLWIDIRVAGKDLTFPVDKELIRQQISRHGRLHDPLPEGLPIKVDEADTTADHGLLVTVGRVNNGCLGRAGVGRREHKRLS